MNPNIYQVMIRENGEIKIVTVTPETLDRFRNDPNIKFMGYMENMFNGFAKKSK